MTTAGIGILAILLVDQVTKWATERYMVLHETIPIIPGFFNLTHVRNTGAAFGLFAGQPSFFRTIFFLTVTLLALGLLGWMYATTPPTQRWTRSGLVLIMGGALGNLIDRLRYGEVVDFLDIYIKNAHWPAFNVADSCITVGVTVLIASQLFGPPVSEQPANSDSDPGSKPFR